MVFKFSELTNMADPQVNDRKDKKRSTIYQDLSEHSKEEFGI